VWSDWHKENNIFRTEITHTKWLQIPVCVIRDNCIRYIIWLSVFFLFSTTRFVNKVVCISNRPIVGGGGGTFLASHVSSHISPPERKKISVFFHMPFPITRLRNPPMNVVFLIYFLFRTTVFAVYCIHVTLFLVFVLHCLFALFLFCFYASCLAFYT